MNNQQYLNIESQQASILITREYFLEKESCFFIEYILAKSFKMHMIYNPESII